MPHTKKKLMADTPGQRMTLEKFIKLMLVYKILTPAEAMTAIETNLLPDDIIDRLHLEDLKQRN